MKIQNVKILFVELSRMHPVTAVGGTSCKPLVLPQSGAWGPGSSESLGALVRNACSGSARPQNNRVRMGPGVNLHF